MSPKLQSTERFYLVTIGWFFLVIVVECDGTINVSLSYPVKTKRKNKMRSSLRICAKTLLSNTKKQSIAPLQLGLKLSVNQPRHQARNFSSSTLCLDQEYTRPNGDSVIFAPSQNAIGVNSLNNLGVFVTSLGGKKPLIVTDKPLVQLGLVKQVTNVLDKMNIPYAIFSEVQPNPTVKNVEEGLKVLTQNGCDSLISVGGGSVHDCAKAIGLVKSNGGKIQDYEGLDKSKNKLCPYIAINTTAGTAAEMTRFSIITNEETHVKMAIVDKNVTPSISINDPVLMTKQPPFLTACTGLDALTHAVEAYVSTAANPVTDACALMAIELIGQYLSKAVANGNDIDARDKMCYAQFLAGLAFNNASLGYVHAIAHQLGGLYNEPHGYCNAILLPSVMKFNILSSAQKLKRVAVTLGENVEGLSDYEAAEKAVRSVLKLRALCGIPNGLTDNKKIKKADFPLLADHALKDVCGFTNPRVATKQDIINILEEAYNGF